MPISPSEGISFSEEDIEEIRKASQDPLFFDNLAGSIAPSLSGMDSIKKALALQLFGGIEKTIDDGTKIPGEIRIMLLADSDDTISQITRSVEHLSLKTIIIYSDMEGITSVPGDVPVLYTVVTHGDHPEPRIAMTDWIDQHIGMMAKYEPVFILRDGCDSLNTDDDIVSDGRQGTVYSDDFIRRYVSYARLNYKPELQERALSIIIDHYQSLCKKVRYMGHRQLETMVRLAEASARSRLSDTVDYCDITRSFEIFDDYLSYWIREVEGINDENAGGE